MKYGLTFLLDVYDFEEDEERGVLTTPGDYLRMQNWAAGNLPREEGEAAELVRDMRTNYALLHMALKRRGKLGDYGLPEEPTVESLDQMADRFSVYVNSVGDGDGQVPLKGRRGK